ncbi:MAG: Uma2 family endonuclease [candidate division WOR-3 bacterium]
MSLNVKKRDLIYERVDGKVIYYKDYELVLKGKKDLEEVMADSAIQLKIKNLLSYYLNSLLMEKGYIVLTSEIGIKLNKGGFRAIDVGIYLRQDFEKYSDSEHYLPISPIVAIEVDTKAQLEKISYMDYIYRKTQDLFQMETIKVIWILTKPKLVLIAQKESWVIKNWNEDIDVIENISFNLEKLLKGGEK